MARADAPIDELLRFQAAACGHLGSHLYEELLTRAEPAHLAAFAQLVRRGLAGPHVPSHSPVQPRHVDLDGLPVIALHD